MERIYIDYTPDKGLSLSGVPAGMGVTDRATEKIMLRMAEEMRAVEAEMSARHTVPVTANGTHVVCRCSKCEAARA